MEAKDTVMSPSELGLHLDYYSAGEISVVRVCCGAHAEISFKAGGGFGYGKAMDDACLKYSALMEEKFRAGIKEVVEWMDDTFAGGITKLKMMATNTWQSKLKDWGIDND